MHRPATSLGLRRHLVSGEMREKLSSVFVPDSFRFSRTSLSGDPIEVAGAAGDVESEVVWRKPLPRYSTSPEPPISTVEANDPPTPRLLGRQDPAPGMATTDPVVVIEWIVEPSPDREYVASFDSTWKRAFSKTVKWRNPKEAEAGTASPAESSAARSCGQDDLAHVGPLFPSGGGEPTLSRGRLEGQSVILFPSQVYRLTREGRLSSVRTGATAATGSRLWEAFEIEGGVG